MMKSMPRAFRRSAIASQSFIGSTMPKCRTGTPCPSTALRWGRAGLGRRQVRDDLVTVEVEVDPLF
jgi:hypothetical protein